MYYKTFLHRDVLNFGSQDVCAVAIKIQDVHYHLTYDFIYNYKNLVLMAGTKNILELNPVTAMPLNSGYLVKSEILLQMPWDYDINSYPSVEIAVVGPNYKNVISQLQQHPYPFIVWAGATSATSHPLLLNKGESGKTLIYFCRNRQCDLPEKEWEKVWKKLNLLLD